MHSQQKGNMLIVVSNYSVICMLGDDVVVVEDKCLGISVKKMNLTQFIAFGTSNSKNILEEEANNES